MELQFSVNGQFIKRLDNLEIVSDSIGFITASFTFSDDWDTLTKVAIFKQGDVAAEVELTADACIVPSAVMTTNRDVIVGVYALDGTDMITTNTARVRCYKSIYVDLTPEEEA